MQHSIAPPSQITTHRHLLIFHELSNLAARLRYGLGKQNPPSHRPEFGEVILSEEFGAAQNYEVDPMYPSVMQEF